MNLQDGLISPPMEMPKGEKEHDEMAGMFFDVACAFLRSGMTSWTEFQLMPRFQRAIMVKANDMIWSERIAAVAYALRGEEEMNEILEVGSDPTDNVALLMKRMAKIASGEKEEPKDDKK